MTDRPWILAVDFGTSFTVAVARVDGRNPEVLEIGGERRVPSVVLTEGPDRVVVGRVADELSSTNPESTLRRPKSRLGDQAPVVLAGRPHQVVNLVAALLAFVYEEAVRQMGSPPSEVRLTHPATWNRPWLNRLQEAAAKAGLPPSVLVPEPVAAAFSFAAEVGVEPGQYIVVYDLGGGTFDTAVVSAQGANFAVVGRPGGDPSIGGELFDEILVNEIGTRLDPAVWDAIQVAADPTWQRVAASLRAEARRAKETLSSHPYADVLLPLPSGMAQLRITRDEFDDLVRPYIEETIALLGRCIDNAGLTPADVSAIYLVGGASRAPIVERLTVEAFPGVPVSRRGDPKTSVAMGAARAETASTPGASLVGPASTEDAAAATAQGDLVLGSPTAADASTAHGAPPPTPPPSAPPPGTAPPPPATAPPVPPPPRSAPHVPPPRPTPAPTAAPAGALAGAGSALTQPLAVTAPVKTRRGILVGVVAAVVALAVVIGAMVLLAGGGDDSSDPPSTDSRRPPRTQATDAPETTDATDTTGGDPTTTVGGTVPPVNLATLEAKLLTLEDVNRETGGGFAETPPAPDGPLPCGLEQIERQLSAVRVFDNSEAGARVVTAIDRYPTLADAARAFAQEEALREGCVDTSFDIDGVEYAVFVTTFDQGLAQLPGLAGRQYLGLLLGYSRVLGPGETTVPAGTPNADTIYQFVVETIDGPNVIGSSYITVGRELTADEIAAYIQLFQLSLNRAIS